MEYLIGFGLSLVAGVVIAEFYGWLPRLNKWLVKRAVAKLDAEDRETRHEEWLAHLGTAATGFSALWLAIGFQIAAQRMSKCRAKIIFLYMLAFSMFPFTLSVRMTRRTQELINGSDIHQLVVHNYLRNQCFISIDIFGKIFLYTFSDLNFESSAIYYKKSIAIIAYVLPLSLALSAYIYLVNLMIRATQARGAAISL